MARAWAHPGWGIVVDARGNLFYTDLKQVWKVTPNGARTVAVSNVHTHELYLDERGTLYGEHLWYDGAGQKWSHYIWELDAAGKVIRHPPQEGFHPDGFFVRDREGGMYWLDGDAVKKRAIGGEAQTLAQIGATPMVAGRMPGGILAVAPDGMLYVARGGDLVRIASDGTTKVLASGLSEHSLECRRHPALA